MPKGTFLRLPEQRKKEILHAAEAEFASHSFHRSSINRIIATSGMAAGSFYQYFEDKKDLYLCVLDNALMDYLDTLQTSDISPAHFFYDKAISGISRTDYDGFVRPQAAALFQNFAAESSKLQRDWILDCVLEKIRGLDPVAEGFYDESMIHPRYKALLPLFLYLSVGVSPLIRQYTGGDGEKTREYARIFREVMLKGLNQ